MTSNVISQDLPIPVESPGTADMIGFGEDGVYVLFNNVNPQAVKVVDNFGYSAGGWKVDQHVRLVGDTTGDRNADIVGFGNNGVWVSLNNGNGTFQDPPKMIMADFSIKSGWSVQRHLRFLADIRKTGRVDIVGFGNEGVWVGQNDGGGKFSQPVKAVADFGYGEGWRLEKHLRFLADVTGDGFLDIVGFADKHVVVGQSNGDGTFQKGVPVLDNFCIYAGGWELDKHPRFVADVNGNGKADILGFGNKGVWIARNDGNGGFEAAELVLHAYGYEQGYRIEKHVRCLADLTGNGRADIIGFADDGVHISLSNPNGTFQTPRKVVNGFGYSSGWRVDINPRFVVDLTGNGAADIVGFGNGTVYVSYNDGYGNFGPVVTLGGSNSLGHAPDQEWSADKTVRWIANLRQRK